MKTILRLMAIIGVALLVAGSIYTLGQTEWAAQQQMADGHRGEGGPPEGFEPGESEQPDGFTMAADVEFEGQRPEGDGHSANPLSARSLIEFTRTLVPMAIIVAVVASLVHLSKRIKRRAKLQAV